MQLLPQKSSRHDNEHFFLFLSQTYLSEDVQFYQVIGRKDLSNAPNQCIGAEMTLLRALAFHPKFLTAVPKTNTIITPPTPSAVENTGNYVDVLAIVAKKSAYSQAKPNKTSIPNSGALPL